MYKELCSALIMTVIIILFAIPMTDLSGESREVPQLLLIAMSVINAGQYIQAIIKIAGRLDVRVTMSGYPLLRVGVLFGLTIIYLMSLQTAGFYLSSLIYFFVTSLLAQPMKVTPALAIKRLAVCLLCVGFLYGLFTVSLKVQIPLSPLGI